MAFVDRPESIRFEGLSVDQYAETIVDVAKIESDFESFSHDQNIQKAQR
jgi:hypothetical protein